MRQSTWVRHVGELREHSRFDVIRSSTLERLGVPRPAIWRRCRPEGPWQRLLPGIVLLSSGKPTRRQRLEAAVMHGGPDSQITGFEAARAHGLRNITETGFIHVLVPDDRQISTAGFTIVERTYRLPEPEHRDGLPTTPLVRAVLDGARRLWRVDPVRAVLAEAVQRGGCSPSDLATELDGGSQRGSAVPRRVINELLHGSRSVAEAEALRVWRRTGLPMPQWNVPVYDETKKLIAVPDAWCQEVRLAWEIDSYEYHFHREGYARTLDRNARYAAAGITVLQTLPTRIRLDPDRVVSEIRAAYQAARNRS
ncbi:hypothetical protein NLX83_01400 [Allokutzneria sp. A3M-2-11 16]|uniref:hypothetical protein n=1 Tax=Allokutzneria sp. A3M-2-11 16 TaxID=2962043 RepID=UPI0020B7CD04|nr:hypothetical protein [Allokutzneria sp. A3M-2-11 16]MCP3797904.1 hypothetical protein [Allokutzneria sp. A3M-2-11 16]